MPATSVEQRLLWPARREHECDFIGHGTSHQVYAFREAGDAAMQAWELEATVERGEPRPRGVHDESGSDLQRGVPAQTTVRAHGSSHPSIRQQLIDADVVRDGRAVGRRGLDKRERHPLRAVHERLRHLDRPGQRRLVVEHRRQPKRLGARMGAPRGDQFLRVADGPILSCAQ